MDARSGRSIRPHPWEGTSELGEIIIMVVRRAQVGPETGHLEERNERAGALLARLMRAVKGGLVTTS